MFNFERSEFDCPCCGKNNMDNLTLGMFDLARSIAGIPFVVSSGTRCKKHNKEVGGKDDSSHPKGYAGDIEYNTQLEMLRMVTSLTEAGFKRIGVGKNFVHADNDPGKKPAKWIY